MQLQEIIDNIKSFPISSIINKFVKLQNAGRMKKKGCCPFHKEKTASFYTNDIENYYKCFGCGIGGDIIHFIQNLKGFEFKQTIEFLCEELNITFNKNIFYNELKNESSKYNNIHLKEIFLTDIESLKIISDFFHNNLFQEKYKFALNYLINIRNLTLKTIKEFNIGYSGNEGDLINFIKNYNANIINQKKINVEQLLEIGIIKKYNDKDQLHEFFKERIMIPIKNHKGDIIAFGGRILNDDNKEIAKYINSSDSYLFKKGEIFFNFYNAKNALKNTKINNKTTSINNNFIIVEGYMDVIMLYQNGINVAIAPLGTSVTEYHLKYLLQYNKTPIFCFDNDKAGKNATKKVIEKIFTILQIGIIPKFLMINNVKDLDEFLLKYNIDDLYELINNKNNIIEIQDMIFNILLENYNIDNPNDKSLMEKELFSLLNTIPEPILKENYKKYCKNKLLSHYNTQYNYKQKNKNNNQLSIVIKKESLYQKEMKILAFLIQNKNDKNIIENENFILNYLPKFSNKTQTFFNNIIDNDNNNNQKILNNSIEKYHQDKNLNSSDKMIIFNNLLINWEISYINNIKSNNKIDKNNFIAKFERKRMIAAKKKNIKYE